MLHQLSKLMLLSVIASASATLAACSLSNPGSKVGNPMGYPFTTDMVASDGKPLVWDCSAVQMSSPPRYACGDNKTYTAFQLRDIRLAKEAAPVSTTPVFEPRHVPQP
jgi:hypothetical protein